MRAILQTNSGGSVSRFFKATLPLALISTGLFLVGFPAPLNGQRALADAPSKTKSPLAKPALTSGAQARPRSISAPDWREELVRTPGAPVTIIEFFDYQCPYCLKTNPALEEAIRKRPGKVRLVLKHFPLTNHPDSMLAHQAALAAGEQGHFWEMHDLLFANQQKVEMPDLLRYAQQLHLDVPRFRQRLESRHFERVIREDTVLGDALGVTATPSFFINGQTLVGFGPAERFEQAIDEALNPGTRAASTPQPLPSVHDLDLSGAPVRGRPDAPITIIEFSDLQCPFCARVTPTLRELIKRYPDQVRWVFKSFPLDFHPDSLLAHSAALAAARQGKFWEMHDLIFAGQQNMKRDNLLAEARSLNLDMARFTTDLDSDQLKQQVELDRREGTQLGVSGTPAFFINGKPFSGAMPLDQFQTVINNELTLLGKTVPAVAATAPSAPINKNPEISFGLPDAPVVLTWFSDLQSGLSLQATLLVRKLIDTHPGQIRLVFKNRPLEIHTGAMLLHEAAMAANAQGKFWQMHDLIIASPQKATREDMMAYAQRIGLDSDRFQKDLDSGKYRSWIEADLQEAQRRAVLGSPVFFLNSARIDGLQNEKLYKDILDGQLAAKK
ncbi:MAG: DsbA family protein [Candidatus Angelobacter sp.]